MQQGPPQASPPEQIHYLGALINRGQDAGFLSEEQVEELSGKVSEVQEAYDTIMEAMKVIQTAYTDLQPEIAKALNEGAKVKNARTVEAGG